VERFIGQILARLMTSETRVFCQATCGRTTQWQVGKAADCRGYIEARTDTTQQPGQTPDKKVDINHITVYISGYTETDTNGVLSPNNG